MKSLAKYLMDNYYSKYHGDRADVVPTSEQIALAYKLHRDKFVIVRDDKIKGVAVFVTLTDETYKLLDSLDITRVDILEMLFKEAGPHVHFVLLCADGYKTIVYGMNKVIKRYRPETVSWWNPDLNKLHKYFIGER